MLLQIPYTLSPFFLLLSEPSNVSVSLGSCGSQNWMCFSKCDRISLGLGFGCRVNEEIEGQKKEVSSSSPMDTVLLGEAEQP